MLGNLSTNSVVFILFLVIKENSLSIIPSEDGTYTNNDANTELSKFNSALKNKQDKDDKAKDKLLTICNQTNIILFDELFTAKELEYCLMIGEGVFGYVYKCGKKVIKVFPVGTTATEIINGKQQRTYTEAYAEIVIATALNALRTPLSIIENIANDKKNLDVDEIRSNTSATDVFNEVLEVYFVEGKYPSPLLDLCKFNVSTPDKKQYMVFDLAYAGLSLENYLFTSEKQAYALFKQVAFGLAIAEDVLQFEHRDLHWNNILITSTKEVNVTFVLKGKVYYVLREGVAASIIDFTHSRITVNETCISPPRLMNISKNFDDPDYAYRIYHLQTQSLGGDYRKYNPFTNILWLHYTLHQMVTAVKLKTNNEEYIQKLKQARERILEYKSAMEYVISEISE